MKSSLKQLISDYKKERYDHEILVPEFIEALEAIQSEQERLEKRIEALIDQIDVQITINEVVRNRLSDLENK